MAGKIAINSEESRELHPEDVVPFGGTTPPDEPEAGLLDEAKQIYYHEKARWNENKNFTWYQWLAYFLPFFGWIRAYDWRSNLLADVAAGLSVAAMVVPQGMSYSQNLAFLPQVYGLYGAFTPCIFYALLGSSRQLAVGPVAVTSLILGSGLTNIYGDFNVNPSDPENALLAYKQDQFNHGAIQVAFIAGCYYTFIGLFRLGWIINLLSHAMISGFMSGAVTIIASSQFKYLTGQSLPRADTLQGNVWYIFNTGQPFKWREFVMGGSFLLILYLMRITAQRFKKLKWIQYFGPLTVCVISIAVMNIWGLYERNPDNPATPYIKPVGKIPKGLPPVTISWWFPLYDAAAQLKLAVLICLVDICESVSIAKSLAQKNHYRLDGTQELRGLGIANIAGAMFNCYTTTGSFSRSAVNNAVGAKTPLAGMITGFAIMVVLLVLTPVFQNMSANVQGAIIIFGVMFLFDWREAIYLWRINKFEFLVWCMGMSITAFAGVEIGIISTVALSVVNFLFFNLFPYFRKLGHAPATGQYKDDRLLGVNPIESAVVLKADGPVNFLNAEAYKEYVRDSLIAAREVQPAGTDPIRFAILDMSAVTQVDATFIHLFDDFSLELRKYYVAELLLAGLTPQVMKSIRVAGLVQNISAEHFFLSTAEAIAYAADAVAASTTPSGSIIKRSSSEGTGESKGLGDEEGGSELVHSAVSGSVANV